MQTLNFSGIIQGIKNNQSHLRSTSSYFHLTKLSLKDVLTMLATYSIFVSTMVTDSSHKILESKMPSNDIVENIKIC